MKCRIRIQDGHSNEWFTYEYDAPDLVKFIFPSIARDLILGLGYHILFLSDWSADGTSTEAEVFHDGRWILLDDWLENVQFGQLLG